MKALADPVSMAGIKLANPLMNGAYVDSKTLADVKSLASSSAGAVLVGSITVKPRQKNPGSNYWLHKERFFSLNSYGLPNGGLPYYRKALPEMVEIAHTCGKPLVANIVGFSNAEFAELLKFAEQAGADIVELNFGCPNVWDKGYQKRIISYHADLVAKTLAHLKKQKPKVAISVKISPLPPDILGEVAKAIKASGIVQIVTATNSYPNASVTSGANQGRRKTDKLVGLAGRSLKPISIGVVKQLRELLPNRIAIIGVGGISSATDAQDYLKAGTSAVQIVTGLINEGPAIFEKILYQDKP